MYLVLHYQLPKTKSIVQFLMFKTPVKRHRLSRRGRRAMGSGSSGQILLVDLLLGSVNIILQRLDVCSLANTAASCSELSHAVPASISTVVLHCQSVGQFESLNLWLGRHGTNLTSCSLSKQHSGPGFFHQTIRELPCPNLRQLHLHNFAVQLEPAGGNGVLHGCTGLTSLHLDRCHVRDFATACAALAALPELRSLKLERTLGEQKSSPIDSLRCRGVLEQLSKLTHLSLDITPCMEDQQPPSHSYTRSLLLDQLPALVSLECLSLVHLDNVSLMDGIPSQLARLTSLYLHFMVGGLYSKLLQHLGSLTALQDLRLQCVNIFALPLGQNIPYKRHAQKLSGIESIESLTRLTSLELLNCAMEISTTNTHGWTNLTALESLSLGCCGVHPAALKPFTQLRALSLIAVLTPFGSTEYGELLHAVANLQQLTKLCYLDDGSKLRHASTASFTALTASTNLCSLQLALMHRDVTGEDGGVPVELFKPGVLYPNLTHIDLEHEPGRYVVRNEEDRHMALDQRQLQQLCISCPALQGLVCVIKADPSPAALAPVLQLSALTHLHIRHLHGQGQDLPAQAAAAAAAAAGVVAIAAQLTGLKELSLLGVPVVLLPSPTLLQLTALTALERLYLSPSSEGRHGLNSEHDIRLQSKAHCDGHADVWVQLLHHLVACSFNGR